MPKIKSNMAKKRHKYCNCTTICTAKINCKNRLRHYRRANIPLNVAPSSVTGTESGEERSEEENFLPTAISVQNLSAADQMMNLPDGHLGSGGDLEDHLNGSGQDTVHSCEGIGPGDRYGELRMVVDEESGRSTVLEDSESEREEFDNSGSEFDEWKEFDEAAEADLLENLSDSDMLSELDLMLEFDDLATDELQAEGWANRQYLFKDSKNFGIKRFLIRK